MPDEQEQPPKLGRPNKKLDLEKAEKLAQVGCTHEEIAYVLEVSVDTLTRNKHFADFYKRGLLAGKRSLRHKQFQQALAGNTTMLIWLGKNLLGQKDAVTNEHTGEITIHDGAKERLIGKLASLVASQPTDEGSTVIN